MADEKPLSGADLVLADTLGQVVAELRAEWAREKAIIVAEAKAAVLELRTACLELLLERSSPEAVARLRALPGGRQ